MSWVIISLFNRKLLLLACHKICGLNKYCFLQFFDNKKQEILVQNVNYVDNTTVTTSWQMTHSDHSSSSVPWFPVFLPLNTFIFSFEIFHWFSSLVLLQMNHYPGIGYLAAKSVLNTWNGGTKYTPKTFEMPKQKQQFLKEVGYNIWTLWDIMISQ